MDIPALSIAMSQSQLQTNVSTAVLDKAIDANTDMGTGLSKMMELSVNPDIGANIDISL